MNIRNLRPDAQLHNSVVRFARRKLKEGMFVLRDFALNDLQRRHFSFLSSKTAIQVNRPSVPRIETIATVHCTTPIIMSPTDLPIFGLYQYAIRAPSLPL